MMGTDPREQPPAMPEVDQVFQQDAPSIIPPVRVEGPVLTLELPARVGTVRSESLNTDLQRILSKDPKRKRALLVATSAWLVSKSGNANTGVTWPANVPLEWLNADELWAAVGTDTLNLTVITEVSLD